MLIVLLAIIILLIVMFVSILIEEAKERRRTEPVGKLEEYWDGRERRRAVRVDAVVNVRYRLLKAKARATKRRSSSENISRLGACLLLDEKLTQGTSMELEIDIPNAPKPIITKAEVAWTKGSPIRMMEKRTFQTGVKFLDTDHHSQEKLSDFIEGLVREGKITPP